MVDRLEKIRDALQKNDWQACVKAAEDLVDLLREPGAVSHAEANKLFDRFVSPEIKWEVREAFARAMPRLPTHWALRAMSRLLNDPNPYVRQTARRSQRLRDQTAFADDAELDSTHAEDLVARLTSMKGQEATQAVREVIYEAQSMVIDEFAHELKNIIQRVLTPVTMIERGLSTTERERIHEPLSNLRKGAKALKSFSDDLRWISEPKSLKISKTSVREVVKNIGEAIKPPRGISLRTPQVEDIQFDAVHERLVRALSNIVRNAVEASPDRGVVIIDALKTPDGEEVEFRITDLGPGVPQKMREEIFSLGQTTKRDGGHHGMGLYLARKVIVVEHGGLILVEDGPEKGAMFKVRIPIAAAGRQIS
jgi:signal transduction histidine kinase